MAEKDHEEQSEQPENPQPESEAETGQDGSNRAGGESSGEQETPEQARIRELEEQLREAEARAEDNWNQFLRARAEMENARRRAEKDVEQAKRQGLEKLASELLPVKDSMEMGLAAAQESNADVAKLTEGSELTLKMLTQAMDKFEITEVDPMGQKFDPERHEAMATQPSAEHEPNTVIHVVQKGYLLGERLLRPAMVIVSKEADQQQGGHIDEQA